MLAIRTTSMAVAHAVLLVGLAVLGSDSRAEEESARYRVERVWAHADLVHQAVAHDVCVREGWAYIGGGGAKSKISKIRLADGEVAWSVDGGSYQPSSPVSNGEVVCLGRYYKGDLVALDDDSGKQRWTFPEPLMGAACFTGDLVCFGGYHPQSRFLFAVDWRTGELRWKAPVGGHVWSTPVVWQNLLIVGCHDGFLYAFDRASGERTWRVDCGGRIEADPVLAEDLAFFPVDDQRVEEPHDNQKVRRQLVVVDLKGRKVLERFRSRVRWHRTVVVDGGQVFFHDQADFALHAYDAAKRKLLYEVKAPSGGFPWPFLTKDRLVFGLRPAPHDCTPRPVPLPLPPCPVAVHDRRTGKRLATYEDGGGVLDPGLSQRIHRRAGGLLLVAGRGVSAWRLVEDP